MYGKYTRIFRTRKEPQKIIKFSPFTTSEKTAGYPAVSYFLVTSSKGVPAGYFVPAGLIVSVLQCVRNYIRGPQKILVLLGHMVAFYDE